MSQRKTKPKTKAARKPAAKKRVIRHKVIELKPHQPVRVVVPKGIIPVVLHDHQNGNIEIAPVPAQKAAKPFSLMDWFFGE